MAAELRRIDTWRRLPAERTKTRTRLAALLAMTSLIGLVGVGCVPSVRTLRPAAAPSADRAAVRLAPEERTRTSRWLADGPPGRALSALFRAQRAAPADPALQLALAHAFQGQGQPGLALWHARQALALDPSEREAHLLVAELLVDAGRYEEALDAVDAALPGSGPAQRARALTLAGRPLRALGRRRDARLVLQRAVFLDPTNARSMLELGLFWRLEGRRAHALHWFERALASDAPAEVHAEARRRRDEIVAVLGHLLPSPDRLRTALE